VTGLDLVRLQLLVAEGEPLPFDAPPPVTGHAIEVRLYAEDAGHDWRPSTGTLRRFDLPHDESFVPLRRPGIRLDSAAENGSVVSAHYDPMLAKVIAWAPSRAEAARALADTLRRARLHGVTTNRDLLVRVLRDREFLAGGTDTAYLGRHPEVFAAWPETVEERCIVALAAALAGSVHTTAPWRALPSGWRNVVSAPQRVAFTAPWGPVEVTYRLDRSGALAQWSVDGSSGPVTLVQRSLDRVVLESQAPGASQRSLRSEERTGGAGTSGPVGVRRSFDIDAAPGVTYVDTAGGGVALIPVPRFLDSTVEEQAGSLLAPMPGTVGRVLVAAGAVVEAGDALVTIEAMKMEHTVRAPEAGTVAAILVAAGDQVEPGAPLAVLQPSNELHARHHPAAREE
jgi:propionyl-CoA carboxylase alpha chain